MRRPGRQSARLSEGHLMPDHVHICTEIPPKHPVASVIGLMKGESAIAMARLCGEERNFSVSISGLPVTPFPRPGLKLEEVYEYIRDQEDADGTAGRF